MRELPGSGDSGGCQHGTGPDRYIVAKFGDFGKASGQPDGPTDPPSGGVDGRDNIGIMVAAPSTIAVIPASLQFATRRAERCLPRSRSRSPIAGPDEHALVDRHGERFLAESVGHVRHGSLDHFGIRVSGGSERGHVQWRDSDLGCERFEQPLSIAVTLTVAPRRRRSRSPAW